MEPRYFLILKSKCGKSGHYIETRWVNLYHVRVHLGSRRGPGRVGLHRRSTAERRRAPPCRHESRRAPSALIEPRRRRARPAIFSSYPANRAHHSFISKTSNLVLIFHTNFFWKIVIILFLCLKFKKRGTFVFPYYCVPFKKIIRFYLGKPA